MLLDLYIYVSYDCKVSLKKMPTGIFEKKQEDAIKEKDAIFKEKAIQSLSQKKHHILQSKEIS